MAIPNYEASFLVLNRDNARGYKLRIFGRNIAPGNLVRIVSDKTNEVWFGLVTKVVNRAPGPQIAIVVTYYQVLEGGLRVANDDLLDLTVTVTNPNEPPSTSPPTPDVGIIDGP